MFLNCPVEVGAQFRLCTTNTQQPVIALIWLQSSVVGSVDDDGGGKGPKMGLNKTGHKGWMEMEKLFIAKQRLRVDVTILVIPRRMAHGSGLLVMFFVYVCRFAATAAIVVGCLSISLSVVRQ